MADVYELKDVLIGDVQHLGRDSDIFQVALGLVQTLEACVGIVDRVTNKKRVFFRESVPFLVFCRPLDVLEDLVELAALHHLIYGQVRRLVLGILHLLLLSYLLGFLEQLLQPLDLSLGFLLVYVFGGNVCVVEDLLANQARRQYPIHPQTRDFLI